MKNQYFEEYIGIS